MRGCIVIFCKEPFFYVTNWNVKYCVVMGMGIEESLFRILSEANFFNFVKEKNGKEILTLLKGNAVFLYQLIPLHIIHGAVAYFNLFSAVHPCNNCPSPNVCIQGTCVPSNSKK